MMKLEPRQVWRGHQVDDPEIILDPIVPLQSDDILAKWYGQPMVVSVREGTYSHKLYGVLREANTANIVLEDIIDSADIDPAKSDQYSMFTNSVLDSLRVWKDGGFETIPHLVQILDPLISNETRVIRTSSGLEICEHSDPDYRRDNPSFNKHHIGFLRWYSSYNLQKMRNCGQDTCPPLWWAIILPDSDRMKQIGCYRENDNPETEVKNGTVTGRFGTKQLDYMSDHIESIYEMRCSKSFVRKKCRRVTTREWESARALYNEVMQWYCFGDNPYVPETVVGTIQGRVVERIVETIREWGTDKATFCGRVFGYSLSPKAYELLLKERSFLDYVFTTPLMIYNRNVVESLTPIAKI